jgi:electron transfer flavoprotein alpha/beta subunit
MSQELKAAKLVAAFLGIPVVTAVQKRKSDDPIEVQKDRSRQSEVPVAG